MSNKHIDTEFDKSEFDQWMLANSVTKSFMNLLKEEVELSMAEWASGIGVTDQIENAVNVGRCMAFNEMRSITYEKLTGQGGSNE